MSKLSWRDAVRKQGAFITGTLLIAGAWCLQTFLIENNKDEIDEFRRFRQEFVHMQAFAAENQYKIMQLPLLKNSLPDSDYTEAESTLYFTQAATYAAWKRTISFMIDGKDSEMVSGIEYNNDMHEIRGYRSNNQINSLISWSQNFNKTSEDRQVQAQTIESDKVHGIGKQNDFIHTCIVGMIIIGTLAINGQKIREYISKETQKINVITKKSP